MAKPLLPPASALTGDERVRVGQGGEARLASTQQFKDYVGTVVGPQGPQGPQGPAGPKGDAGPSGAVGAQGLTGAKGDAGPAGPQGATGPAGPAGQTGATGAIGATGAKGATGDPGATPLGTITVSETISVAIGAGIRRVTVTTPTAWGVAAGQNLVVFPTAVPSAAYATHDVIATGPNTISVAVSTPALALLATYSITCRLVRIAS